MEEELSEKESKKVGEKWEDKMEKERGEENKEENKKENKWEDKGEKEENKEEVKGIASRGIPSSQALYLPPYNSRELRRFQDEHENLSKSVWTLEEVINFVFPKKYQERYHETALLFLQALIKNIEMNGEMTGDFIADNNLSKATFYNRVLPRMKRIGLIKVERETITAKESKRKYRPMVISLSKTFGNYLTKIADSWLAVVENARYEKKKQNI